VAPDGSGRVLGNLVTECVACTSAETPSVIFCESHPGTPTSNAQIHEHGGYLLHRNRAPMITLYPISIHSEKAEIVDEGAERSSGSTIPSMHSLLYLDEKAIRARPRRDRVSNDPCARASVVDMEAGRLVVYTRGRGSSTGPEFSKARRLAKL
jgi:hypothetical protein